MSVSSKGDRRGFNAWAGASLALLAAIVFLSLTAGSADALSADGASIIGTAGDQAEVAADPGGNATAVWRHWNGSRWSVWGSRFSPTTGWATPIQLSVGVYDNASTPWAVADAAGNAVVIWLEASAMENAALASRFVPGSGWGPARIIGENLSAGYDLQAAAGANGDVFVVWTSWTGSTRAIYANRFTPSAGWENATAAEAHTSGNASLPTVAVDDSGRAVVVWSHFEETNVDVRSSRFDPSTGWSSAAGVETSNRDAYYPRIAIEPGGNAMAVWQQGDADGWNVWASRFVVGVGWGAPIRIESNNSGVAHDPQVAADASGNAVAVWYQNDGNEKNIWVNRYAVASGWGEAAILDFDVSYADEVQVFLERGGNGTAIWHQFNNTRVVYDILASPYVVGLGWGTPAIIDTEDRGDAWAAQISADGVGNFFGVWIQQNGSGVNVWANRFRATLFDVSIESEPAGLEVRVNNVSRVTPFSVTCGDGFAILLNATSPQGGPATRFVFADWSDGGAAAHDYLCRAPTALRANFTREHLVAITTQPQGLRVLVDGAIRTAPLSFWWPEGSEHGLDILAAEEIGPVRYAYGSWSDGGAANHSIVVSAAASLQAAFDPSEYLMLVSTAPEGLDLRVDGSLGKSPLALWWAVGSTHVVEALTPQMADNTSRYAFDRWSDAGATAHNIQADAPKTISASFGIEFKVELATTPGNFSILIDGVATKAPASVWFANGSSHTFEVLLEPQVSEDGSARYTFVRWQDDAFPRRTEVVTGPATFLADFTLVDYLLVIDTLPSSLRLIVNGVAHFAPYAAWWPVAYDIEVRLDSPQVNGGQRNRFLYWEHGGPQNQTVTLSAPVRRVAVFGTEFELAVATEPAGLQVWIGGVPRVAPATAWFPAGAEVSVGTVTPQSTAGGSRLVGWSWSDGGAQNHSVTVSAPISLVVKFQLEYLLTVVSAHGGAACDAASCWYAAGGLARVQVENLVNGTQGTRYVFDHWQGQASGSAAEVRVFMDAPKEVTAVWRTQYYLDVETAFGQASGEDWYDAGSVVRVVITPKELTVNGTTYRFAGWEGEASSASGDLQISMDSPRKVVAIWDEVRPGGQGTPAWMYAALGAAAIGGGSAALYFMRSRRIARSGKKTPDEQSLPEGRDD